MINFYHLVHVILQILCRKNVFDSRVLSFMSHLGPPMFIHKVSRLGCVLGARLNQGAYAAPLLFEKGDSSKSD